MGLNPNDKRPHGIGLREAYTNIHAWYKANINLIEQKDDDYGK
jgi:hypothetical protein